ncbi:MAG: 3-oxoacyl-ACP reductase FabG [Chlamydiae bacterium]|nr:3-oxoacyl-ACP reductase FabG [Chlamydiota bacterium]
MRLLEKKKAIVTGGTAGIGKEIAAAFAKEGAHVAIFGTHAERAAEVLRYLETLRVGPEQTFSSYLVDVSSKQAVEEAINAVITTMGSVDILVNNAGITKDQLLMKMSEADWDSVLDTNLKSVYNTCSCLVRSMLKARFGKIINITSIVGLIGNPGQTNYAAAKAGMIGFTKALAQELASRNICVNCIAPGFIQTKMTDALTEEQKQQLLQRIPMKRWGQPEEIAKAALFLASSMADYITGQVLTVDGGMVM